MKEEKMRRKRKRRRDKIKREEDKDEKQEEKEGEEEIGRWGVGGRESRRRDMMESGAGLVEKHDSTSCYIDQRRPTSDCKPLGRGGASSTLLTFNTYRSHGSET
ncbi:uncharacterized [Tachysurus ichikawai]